MDKKIISKQVIIEKGGIAKTSDFVAAGIPAVDIVIFVTPDTLNAFDTDTISLPMGTHLLKNSLLQH